LGKAGPGADRRRERAELALLQLLGYGASIHLGAGVTAIASLGSALAAKKAATGGGLRPENKVRN
jgi:hypothetical protein